MQWVSAKWTITKTESKTKIPSADKKPVYLFIGVCLQNSFVWLHQLQLSSPDSGKNCSWVWDHDLWSQTSLPFLTPGFPWELDLPKSSPHQLWWTEDNSVQFRLLLSAAQPPQQLCPNCLGRLNLSYPPLLLSLRVNIVVVSFSSAPDQPLSSSFQQHQRSSWQLIHPGNKEEFPSNQLVWQWISECPERRTLL